MSVRSELEELKKIREAARKSDAGHHASDVTSPAKSELDELRRLKEAERNPKPVTPVEEENAGGISSYKNELERLRKQKEAERIKKEEDVKEAQKQREEKLVKENKKKEFAQKLSIFAPKLDIHGPTGKELVTEMIQKRNYEKEFNRMLAEQPTINPIALELSLKGKYKIGKVTNEDTHEIQGNIRNSVITSSRESETTTTSNYHHSDQTTDHMIKIQKNSVWQEVLNDYGEAVYKKTGSVIHASPRSGTVDIDHTVTTEEVRTDRPRGITVVTTIDDNGKVHTWQEYRLDENDVEDITGGEKKDNTNTVYYLNVETKEIIETKPEGTVTVIENMEA